MAIDVSVVSEIIPRLFLTNWDSSQNINILEQYDIHAIITLEETSRDPAFLNHLHDRKIGYMHIYLPDSLAANIFTFFGITYDYIDKYISAGKNVMINCRMGVSRSSTIVINYLVRKYYEIVKQPVDEQMVLNFVSNIILNKRPFVRPNYGFIQQLIAAARQYKSRNQIATNIMSCNI